MKKINFRALFKERNSEIIDDFYKLTSFNGSMMDTEQRENFIIHRLPASAKKDEVGNITCTLGSGPLHICIAAGLDDGIFASIDRRIKIYKKNLFGIGIIDDIRLVILIKFLSVIEKEKLLKGLKITFLFHRGQNSNNEGLHYFLKNRTFDICLTMNQHSVNRMGIKPVSYVHLRVHKNSGRKDPYFELCKMLYEIEKSTTDWHVMIKKLIHQGRKGIIPKMAFGDLLFSSPKLEPSFLIKKLKNYLKSTGADFNIVQRVGQKANPMGGILREFFESTVNDIAKMEKITLLPIETGLPLDGSLINASGTPAFDMGLFTFSCGSIVEEEIILPTVTLGTGILYSMLEKISIAGEEILKHGKT